ncbi:hypothetical protein THAOC_31647 [Thalassiosira oceanica]|uniref:Uncharacterized protein n=1 Tax=Thalassiosira oceanica TaxID=159749 RepID=K0R8T0_THAOC|nr:hypothetical protein THAOC_31647 [Thalassiosira oceanica]|eukprot:EJK49475.1 hypothetical protein THAOC_31647 [Thalassiosira oceanica]
MASLGVSACSIETHCKCGQGDLQSLARGQKLCSLNQSSGSRVRSPILERGAMIKWELSTGGSLPSPTSEGLMAAAAADPAYQSDQQLCCSVPLGSSRRQLNQQHRLTGCRGGSFSMNKSSGQPRLHHSRGWVRGSSPRRRKHVRAALRLIALLARFHPLVAVAQPAIVGSKTAAKFHSAGCPIQPWWLVALAQSAAARQRSLIGNFDGPSLGGGGRDQMRSGSAGSDWTSSIGSISLSSGAGAWVSPSAKVSLLQPKGNRPDENVLAAAWLFALPAEAHSGSLTAHRLVGGIPSLCEMAVTRTTHSA